MTLRATSSTNSLAKVKITLSSRVMGQLENFSVLIPFLVTLGCMAIPLKRFIFRNKEAANMFRQGQRLRDIMLILSRRTNQDLNQFVSSLDDNDHNDIRRAMDVICARL